MRLLPQAVLVVTTSYDGAYWGLTMSSATSASINPPLFLVCIDRNTPSYEPIIKRGVFVVNLLSEEQMAVSDVFAGRFKAKDKFKNVKFRLSESGLPVLEGTLGNLECTVWKVYDGGDHDVVLGKVERGDSGLGWPIVYYDQTYAKVGRWESAQGLYPQY